MELQSVLPIYTGTVQWQGDATAVPVLPVYTGIVSWWNGAAATTVLPIIL